MTKHELIKCIRKDLRNKGYSEEYIIDFTTRCMNLTKEEIKTSNGY